MYHQPGELPEPEDTHKFCRGPQVSRPNHHTADLAIVLWAQLLVLGGHPRFASVHIWSDLEVTSWQTRIDMGLRLRLILAFLLVALAPLALLAWSVRPILDRGQQAIVEQRARELGPQLSGANLRARLEAQSFDMRDRILAAQQAGDLDLDALRSERNTFFARRKRERAQRKLAELLPTQDLDRIVLMDGSRLLFAVPAEAGQQLPPGRDVPRSGWRWEADRGVLILSTAVPPDETHVADRWDLLLLAERSYSPERLAVEFSGICGVPVSVTPRLPGQPDSVPTPSERALATLHSGRGATVAILSADLSTIGTLQRSQVATRLLLALAVGAGLALVLAALFASLLAQPLRRLSRAVSAVADHPSEPETMPSGAGEVGRLASAVNRMLAALRREQKRRARAERSAAWQEVARRVAHEVRNPLTPIRLGVDNLRRAQRRGPEPLAACLDEEAEAILSEVERLERLVREFSQFARLPRPKLELIDPIELVRKAAMGQVGAHDEITLELTAEGTPIEIPLEPAPVDTTDGIPTKILPEDTTDGIPTKLTAVDTTDGNPTKLLPEDTADGVPTKLTAEGTFATLRADPDLLAMAVANLSRNAAQAMGPEGGTLRIAVAKIEDSGVEFVEICFEDSGPGIPEQLIDQLFEPYVTGRGESGTGLGLAIVRQVVCEHGGRVLAENRPEGGARFRILLPRRPRADVAYATEI